MFKNLFYTILILVSIFSCREEEVIIIQQPADPVIEDSTSNSKVNINGYVQKGPFINGTTLIITELDDSLAATGKTFTTQITDNRGSFFIKTSQLDYTNLQLIATGFYFDEVKGKKSAAQLTLFALADVSTDARINVNILSHLEKDRVLYLINQGKDFLEAKAQAQAEILAIFGIEKEDMQHSELLDISQAGEDNAILLAISAILQGENSVAQLSELLADISTDLREDGMVNSEKILEALKHNAINLDLPAIRQHLVKRYEELSVEASIANFEQYVDSDGDGILNKDDDNTPDEFVFTAVENAKRNTVYLSEVVTISGLPYPAIAQLSEGELIKNGESIGQDTAYVSDGDELQIKMISPISWGGQISSLLTVGDYQTSFALSNEAYPWATAVSGYLQVGPFSNGASFALTQLDSSLSKTDKSFNTQTTNSQGAYQKGEIEVDYPWAIVEGKGYYYDFINTQTSESEMQLNAYTDLSTNDQINANVLTHLEVPRVKYLMNSGLSFTEAKQQAQKEVLAVFEIQEDISTLSEHFDITKNNTEGAILLAISAILQGYESTGTLQELLRNISEDLETDGTLDNPVLGSALINNAMYLNLASIRTTVNNKYKELGKTITVADFEKCIKAFINTTEFTLTKKIEYPASGIYGENILSGKKTKYPKETREIGAYVNLPSHSKLDIRITAINPKNFSFGTLVREGWTYVDSKNGLVILRANQTGEIKFQIDIFEDTKIEVFENGATTPTRIINIDAY
ncbi:hypothetical protein OKW21_004819 [Catalinimonas alkaloidigena]|uniref:hypothetical protein n=1 Tax=Catalinimonas alkaloidigena TaxID=1075417 RepID=UPI00240629F8|nr:hypothetical protein [Catalinimonas alkaloidigena]MDF9799556.1 hypothetical protein [Catalinimonas alkaloidigena]